MTGAPDQRQFPVFQEGLHQLSQRQLLWLSIHQGQENGAEIALQRRSALQFGEHFVGFSIAAKFHHDAHAFAIAFIPDVGNPSDLAVIDLVGEFFDPAGLAELVRQFGDDHCASFVAPFSRLDFLDVGDAPHRNASPPAQIRFTDAGSQQHLTACGEIGPRDHR